MAGRGTFSSSAVLEQDYRFMAAAIRFSRRHLGLTGTNPSVATLIVRDDSGQPSILGRGITALGGRPHAETQALAEAGAQARGATAYVTLEPCAHHGRTPPCAEALIAAGVKRVVGAARDPDPRVSGRGYQILRNAGIEVVPDILADQAEQMMKGYFIRNKKNRVQVTVKLALSLDGMMGIREQGHFVITGKTARRQVHLMRAEADAILVGIGTALADDPTLTCRLPGLEKRSPVRIVLDRHLRLPLHSTLVRSAREVPLFLAAGSDILMQQRAAYAEAGGQFLAVEIFEGKVALPELAEDLASRGYSTLFVEGGACVIRSLLAEELIDRLCLFVSPRKLGNNGIAAPVTPKNIPDCFSLVRQERFGKDKYFEYNRKGDFFEIN